MVFSFDFIFQSDAIKPAMDRIIQKMFQRPVWEYWSHDSAGVTKFEPNMDRPYPPFSDPIAYRNIMYSGHVSQMINLYQMLYNERKRLIADSAALQISRPVHWVFGRC